MSGTGKMQSIKRRGVLVTGPGFTLEIKGEAEAVEQVRAAVAGALAPLPGVTLEEGGVFDPFEEEWFTAAVSRLTPGRVLEIRAENKGYGVRRLSELSGIAESSLSSMIKGRRAIGPKNAGRLAAVLECSEADFLGFPVPAPGED